MALNGRFRWTSELAVLVGVVIVIAGVFKVYQTADNVHKAVCALRADRVKSIEESVKFVHQHPNGIPGISRADIERSIEQQRVTVRAFSFADC